MKKILYLLAVGILSFSCNEKKVDGVSLLKILNDENLSLVVFSGDSISKYDGARVDDLMHLVTTEPEQLRGAVIADRQVGNAAASLIAFGGVKEVHTNYVTHHAKSILEKAGVNVVYATEGDFIHKKDNSGQCPMDSTLNSITDYNEGFDLLKAKFYED